MGSQAKVESKAAAPLDTHTVYTIAVVPRHATKLALSTIKVADATNSSANLAHDICYVAKTSKVATCPTKPLKSIPMQDASFFTQAVTTAIVSKAA